MLLFLGIGYLAHGGSSTWSVVVVVVVMDFLVSSMLYHVTVLLTMIYRVQHHRLLRYRI